MANGWQTVSLAQVLRQDTDYVTELEPIIYPKLSVKLYGKGVTLDTPADGANVKMQRHQFAKLGQVILSEIWAKKGAIGIVPPDGEGALVTSHFFLFDIDETKVLPAFIGWLLKGNFFAELLNAQAHGTTGYAAVRPKQFLALEIPLPPLTEQRRIVVRIEALARRVAEGQSLRREASEEAKSFMQAALREVFGKSANWENHKLDEVAPINMGQSPSGDSYNADGEGFPLLNGPTEFGQHHPTPRQWTTSPTKFCKPGDILICVRGATTGKMNWADQKYCIGRGLAALTVDTDKCIPEYVFYFVQTQTQEILARTAGSTFPNLPGEKLKTLPIPVPPLEEQWRLVAYLDGLQAQMFQLRTHQEETQKELSAFMPSILDKAFKGEL
jgi:type I restriction enzyme S subunit